MQQHLNLLGYKVKDKVTGFSGKATSICFDLYGCIQCLIHPGLDKEGKPADQNWFDVSRIEITDQTPVM